MELKGKTIAVLPMNQGVSSAGKAWQNQEFVIETEGQYPKKACFRLFGDKVAKVPVVGSGVTVIFDVDSREYNGRWYTQLNAYEVLVDTPAAPIQPISQPVEPDDSPF